MKLELYKPYRTHGGFEVILVEVDAVKGRFLVWVPENQSTVWYEPDGKPSYEYEGYTIIAEWYEPKPPRTCEFWVNINADSGESYPEGAHLTKEMADRFASSNRIDCKRYVWTEGE